jgi:hypothetical protein
MTRFYKQFIALIFVAIFTAACGSAPTPQSPTQQAATSTSPSAAPTSQSPTETASVRRDSMKIRFTIGHAVATATLDDNPTARDFASLLPVTLTMQDLFGREKPGPLPRTLNEGGKRQFSYEIGQVIYWSPTHDLAIYYADDGQRTIPSPGIIVLGKIDSGLNAIASAGDNFQMTVGRIG